MTYVAVATTDELQDREPLAVEFGDYAITIVRCEDEFFAITDACSHANVPLSEGEVEDCKIECYLHGSLFDLRTGYPLNPPATQPVPVYPVRVDGSGIMVDFDHPIMKNQES